MNEESLFADALEKTTPAERRAFLDEACGDDVALRQRVEQLLSADQHSQGILERGADGDFVLATQRKAAPHDVTLIAEGPGTFIGPYKLKEQIGEGGFGLVFVAEQQQPVRRKVALKIIKPGMDTREVIARFEAERQALALMDHPNIARILDAGWTGQRDWEKGRQRETGLPGSLSPCLPVPLSDPGRPYFVMELVRGVPITDYCDQQQVATRERLELFVCLCHAVQHAHQKGIIHRDLKPSNIMVTVHDGKPVIKVIDFGVAKALNQQLTEHSVYTRFAQLMGTPAYMSPEQAEMSGLDVDTRSDIYSLGVLLYELLTGSTPFDKKRLATVGLDELRRIIREEEPEKPSTRLCHSKDTLIGVAAQRKTEPAKLTRLIRGELDWIVMKAIEKDRTRRFESAGAFARDVQRYLSDEPVEACPPSAGYRLAKFVRRNRGAVLTAAVIFLVLVAGIIGTSLGLLEARHAQAEESLARHSERLRAAAETKERIRAEGAEADAKQREKEAKAALEITAATVQFMLIDLLGQAGAKSQITRHFEPDPNLTIRTALDRAAGAVGEKFKDQPELEAAIRQTLGAAYSELGIYEQAIPQLRESARIRAARNHVDAVNTMHSLAQACREAGRTAEAIQLFEQVRDRQMEAFGPDHLHTLSTLNNLAAAYRDARDMEKARALLQQVRDAKVRTLGTEDPSTLTTLSNLATVNLDMGRTAEATQQLEKVLASMVKARGLEHPDTTPTLNNLALAFWKAKQLDKSIPLFEKTLAANRKIHGDGHPHTVTVMANLGINYRDAERMTEAIPLLEKAERAARKHAPLRWVTARELIIAYERAGKWTEGMALCQELLALARSSLPARSSELADALGRIGSFLSWLKAWPEAETVLRENLVIRSQLEPDDWHTFDAQSMLGEALLGQKQFIKAGPLLLNGYQGLWQRQSKMDVLSREVRQRRALERLVQFYDAVGNQNEAAKWRKELAAAQGPQR